MATSNGNGADLTEKQAAVLDLLSKGKSVTEIGRKLGSPPNVVYSHLTRLRSKGYINEENRVVGTAAVESVPEVDLSGGSADSASSDAAAEVFSMDQDVSQMLTKQRESLSGTLGEVRRAMMAHQIRIEEIEKEAESHREAIVRLKSHEEQAASALNALGGAVAEATA